MVVPTGVGASIGGYAGDATPQLNLLASVTDVLVTHPNVANAAVLQKLPANALYVEGYGLDQFMRGRWALQPVRGQRIGVVLDAGIPPDMRILHINVMNAVKAVHGLDLVGYAVTQEPVDVTLGVAVSGCSGGQVGNPQVLIDAGRRLIEQGATALAVCVLLPEADGDEAGGAGGDGEAAYRAGSGVDVIGGIEGILSHWMVSELGVPCAHAPVFPWAQAKPVRDAEIAPRAAAEYIAPTFLPCVLTGLQQAPAFRSLENSSAQLCGGLTVSDLSALVIPADVLGGLPVWAALSAGVPVLAVAENRTVLAMDQAQLDGLPPARRCLIRQVGSYEEAAGVLQAMRLGLIMSAGENAVQPV